MPSRRATAGSGITRATSVAGATSRWRVFDRHACHRADDDPVGGKAELGEHAMRNLWTEAHDHDPRTVDDRLVAGRDIDGGKAPGEAGRDLGVARRQQHLMAHHRRSRTTP